MNNPSRPEINITSLVRKNILALKPYSSARDEFKGEAEVFLDANENPYPSPYNRYPDPLQRKLKYKVAALKDVRPEQIFLGNGSDEPIDLLIRGFCEPYKDAVLITEPTYGMYAVCAGINAVEVKTVLLSRDFDLDPETFPETFENIKIIFLCSPNNPTGNLLDSDKILSLLERFNGLVVIDEAYIDFAERKSFTQYLDRFSNLVILQTFSKAWGLAGLRLGMCFASEAVIQILNKIKYPYNINISTQELGLKALDEEDQKNAWVKEILLQRTKLVNDLQKLQIVERVYPSDANFVLARVKHATSVYHYLTKEKIIVRDRSRVALCEDCLRITVGTQEENERLIKALKQL